MTAEMIDLLALAGEGEEQATETLLLQNAGLIWGIVRRYYGRGVDADDLYQLGCMGFLKAVRGFNLEYGTQFSTYAVPKIAGEIRRFLRDDGAVKVSRSLKEQAVHIHMARERLRLRGDEPSLSDLAAETGLTPEEIAAAELADRPVQSLHAEYSEGGQTLEDLLGTDAPEERMLEHLTLREAIETLPERERTVIMLRFYRDLTQEKAAQILGVSQVQVSRLEKKAMEKLRTYLVAGE